MRLITKELPLDHNIFLVGDIHEGSVLTHRNGMQSMIKNVLSSKNNYVVLMGDLVEGICVDDKRYQREMEDKDSPTVILQYKSLVKMFKPIADRVLVALEGNHDHKVGNKFGNCVKAVFCDELGVEFGTYSCKLTVTNKKKLQYKAFLTHGNGSISSSADDPVRRESNMFLALKRKLSRKAADCAIQAMGHSHKLLVKPPISELYLVDEGDAVKQQYTRLLQQSPFIPADLRWYVNTGSFMKLYGDGVSGYAERAMYDPVELGYPVIVVKGGIINSVDRIVL